MKDTHSSSQPSTSVLRAMLTTAGVTAIAVGLLHFFMPGEYRNSAGLSDLSNAEDDFVVLVTSAVGILLIAFGATTLVFGRRPERHPELLYYYLLIAVALWAARLVLELLYPLDLRMFGIEPFTLIVAPGVAIELALLAVAAVQARRMQLIVT